MWKRLKHLFIPCEGNAYRPDFLERVSVGIILVLILLSFAMANLQALLWISSDWLVSTILPAVIVDLTNDERKSGELATLTRNTLLDEAARLKAEDMAKNGYFAHYSPTGISPWYWFEQVSYDFVSAGENLAVHFTDSEDVVNAWMESPSHRANIMSGKYQEIGVGTAKGEYKGNPTIFVVQLFGTQKAPEPTTAEVAGVATGGATASDISLESVTTDTTTETEETPREAVAPASIENAAPDETEVKEEMPTASRAEERAPEVMEPLHDDVLAVAEESVVMYSDLATTSRPGTPLSITPSDDGEGGSSAPLRSATEPSLWLQFVYSILAGVVVVALILSVFIEWKRQHPVQIAYAGGLLMVMALLLYIHIELTSNVTIV